MGTYMKLNKCIPAEKNDKIIFRNYKKYDAEAFNKELAENIEISQIQEQIENGDVNQATATLMKTIQDTAQNHAPVVEATCRNKKKPIPWFSAELKAKIKEKNELLMDYYQSGIKSYKDRIKALGNKITQQKRNLKQEYIAEKMEEAGRDSNKCWKLLNAVTNRLIKSSRNNRARYDDTRKGQQT